MKNRQWVLRQTPAGTLIQDDFEWREARLPVPSPGEVLVRNLMMSIDPAARSWMKMAIYRAQVMPGDVMHGWTLSQVVQSESPLFKPGELVECMGGWQDYALTTPDQMLRRDPRHSLKHLIGVYSITGTTAYHGMFEIGRPCPGETVLVSAAAGGVGSIAGQLARLAGCRVVGVTGGSEKCDWIIREFGFDAAVDHSARDFRDQLVAACPDGVDVYFDNVAGPVLDAALGIINIGARIVACGSVARYDSLSPVAGSSLLPSALTARRATMEGFVVLDYAARRGDIEHRLARLVAAGRLKAVVDVEDGFDRLPGALIRLLSGGNRGKLAVRVADLEM
jgi:NADPH-dependent curcumin reductase CurA